MKDSITLQWTNERPNGTDEAVIADIATSLGALKSPEDLHYHTVFLGSDMEMDPGVIVEGEHGNRNFVCTYYPVIGDAFETSRPNAVPDGEVSLPFYAKYFGSQADGQGETMTFGKTGSGKSTLARIAAIAKELGLDKLSLDELKAVKDFVDDAIAAGSTDAAVRAFLRGRGGKKAERSEEDFTLGHDALQRRKDEAEQQDKGA